METARHTFHQTSVIAALLDGVLDGDTTVGTLRERGDFGLGTFDALDGEMVLLDGTCFRLREDGSAEEATDAARTPFAVVTRFVAHRELEVTAPTTRAELTARIDATLGSTNYLYAVRVDGTFSRVRVRAVAAQQHPYPRLDEVTEHESIAEFADAEGTVVGFRTPAFERGVSVPGYHAHFLGADRTGGGHIQDYVLERGRVAVCIGTDLHLELPRTAAFAGADLDPDDLDSRVTAAES